MKSGWPFVDIILTALLDTSMYVLQVFQNIPCLVLYVYNFTRSIVTGIIWPPEEITVLPRFDIDLKGKICVVVGGATGIGREIVEHLFVRRATVYVLDLTEQTVTKVFEELISKHPDSLGSLKFIHCNLGSIETTKQAADELRSHTPVVHCCYLNAGIPAQHKRKLTEDGFESVQQINCYAHLTFLHRVVSILKRGNAHVVATGSVSHITAMHPVWTNLQYTEGHLVKGYSGWQAYAQSKTMLALNLRYYQNMQKFEGIHFFISDPLVVKTKLGDAFITVMFGKRLPDCLLRFNTWVNGLVSKTPLEACDSFVALGYDDRFRPYAGSVISSYKQGFYHWMLRDPDTVYDGFLETKYFMEQHRLIDHSLSEN